MRFGRRRLGPYRPVLGVVITSGNEYIVLIDFLHTRQRQLQVTAETAESVTVTPLLGAK